MNSFWKKGAPIYKHKINRKDKRDCNHSNQSSTVGATLMVG